MGLRGGGVEGPRGQGDLVVDIAARAHSDTAPAGFQGLGGSQVEVQYCRLRRRALGFRVESLGFRVQARSPKTLATLLKSRKPPHPEDCGWNSGA